MPDDRPNVLFVMTDQQRGDSVGADPACPEAESGGPLVHTPNVNSLAGSGTLFERAYSPASSSIPARRCLWTGQTPVSANATNYHHADWEFERSLPEALTDAGYQTRLVGKTHSIPERNHFGFEHMELHAGLADDDDYENWLADRRPEVEGDVEISHGAGRNSWDARPWHLDETEHPTNWTTDRALRFLETQDPTRPYFLTVSYVRPHQPYDPPQHYWDQYDRRDDIPDPAHGDWVEASHGEKVPEHPDPAAWCADLPADVERRARVGYYGSVTHVDHQIQRLLNAVDRSNTVVVFAADHGDALGDHLRWRKCYATEGSARVPMVIDVPGEEQPTRVPGPVGLTDLMPTLLSLCDVPVPDTVEGADLAPVLRGERDVPREFYHHEHGPIYDPENAYQSLVGERWKYVWNPVTGRELLFDLQEDPHEEVDRSGEASDVLADFRTELVERIADRADEFDADLPEA
jgi:arylsulfatase A-like enzyme